MAQLSKKRQNGHSNLFPSLKKDFLRNGFSTSALFDDNFFADQLSFPRANLIETYKEFRIELSAPGLSREDFNVVLENGVLTISCEKEEETEQNKNNYKKHEFSYSNFSRQFTLPENCNENKISAKYENGLLCITLPKKETSEPKPKRQININ